MPSSPTIFGNYKDANIYYIVIVNKRLRTDGQFFDKMEKSRCVFRSFGLCLVPCSDESLAYVDEVDECEDGEENLE